MWELKSILDNNKKFLIDSCIYVSKNDKTICNSIDEIDYVEIYNLRNYKSYIDLSHYLRSHKQITNIVFDSDKSANVKDNIIKLKKRLIDEGGYVLVARSDTIETIKNIFKIEIKSIAADKLPETGFWNIIRSKTL